MKQQLEFCPLCKNHCPKEAVRCEKGYIHFNGNGNDAENYRHAHRPHFGAYERHDRHFEDQVPKDSLMGLLMRCGHHLFRYLHHGGDEKCEQAIFAGLTDVETNELKGLLTKLLNSWHKQES